MKIKSLILLAIFSLFILSCEKDMTWINAKDPQADSEAIALICAKHHAECGDVNIYSDGKFHLIFCGNCETGYKCDNDSNKCYDIDECSRPELNDCPENSTCANEEGTYSCICNENYSGDDCVPGTRTKECENLPENAEWNTASSITQTWNGTSWEPSTTGIYSEEESNDECRFKCKEHYNWDISLSVCEAETRTADCTGLPENAEWNGSLSLMQTWNGEEWTPASEATFNKIPGECTFQCSTGFYWNEGKCETAPTQTVECTGLPENAHWHSPSSITQTWNGDEWLPSNLGVYSENGGSNECNFECDSNYYWNDNQCLNPCDSNPCNSISNSTGTCTPSSWEKYSCGCKTNYTWNGYLCSGPCDSNPCSNVENSTGTCSTSSLGKYSCECKTNYTWNGSLCTSPCDSDPCSNVENSTGTCILTSKDSYKCECEDTYLWRNSKCNKITLGNICTGQDKCYDHEKEIECPALNDDFFGQDAQYAKIGTCIPHNFEIKNYANNERTVIDKNTGLEWQHEISSGSLRYYNSTDSCAYSYCNDLNLGNHDDWRLPTVNELFSIIDSGKYGPALDTNYFSNIPTAPDSYFWTSESFLTQYSSNQRVVRIYNGESDYHSKESYGYSICVRGNGIFPPAQLTTEIVNGDEIIIDSASGLIWQKNHVNSGGKWIDALSYCEKSTYAGYNDWKLPNKNELASLTKTRSSSTVNESATDFPELLYGYSSSTNLHNNSSSLGFNFQVGTCSGDYGKTQVYPVICVRAGLCDKGYGWNGTECVKCDPTPCIGIEKATGQCVISAWNEFSCECEGDYTWNGSTCDIP